jgi:hypothetical protein
MDLMAKPMRDSVNFAFLTIAKANYNFQQTTKVHDNLYILEKNVSLHRVRNLSNYRLPHSQRQSFSVSHSFTSS